MKTSPVGPTVTRRPSLMQLFGLRDRTNTVAVADPVTPKSARDSDAPPPPHKKERKTAKPAYDEAELVRRYGRAFVSEVALLQFMDGGSTEHNVRRVLKRRAKLDPHEERLPLLPDARSA